MAKAYDADELLKLIDPANKGTIEVDCPFGAIDDVAEKMIKIAQITGKNVSFEFNKIALVVEPKSDLVKVCESYARQRNFPLNR